MTLTASLSAGASNPRGASAIPFDLTPPPGVGAPASAPNRSALPAQPTLGEARSAGRPASSPNSIREVRFTEVLAVDGTPYGVAYLLGDAQEARPKLMAGLGQFLRALGQYWVGRA